MEQILNRRYHVGYGTKIRKASLATASITHTSMSEHNSQLYFFVLLFLFHSFHVVRFRSSRYCMLCPVDVYWHMREGILHRYARLYPKRDGIYMPRHRSNRIQIAESLVFFQPSFVYHFFVLKLCSLLGCFVYYFCRCCCYYYSTTGSQKRISILKYTS